MSVPAALDPEALLAKSKVYIRRALARKDIADLDEYQLWASLALELLGKSALASTHPCLIADPQHYESLFAAAGRMLSTDVKTITAKTLFLRLGHVSRRFDKTVAEFCEAISQRRNAELHSGDAPFRAMRLEAWETKFWHAADVILEIAQQDLGSWIGANEAQAPQALLTHAASALQAAVTERIATSRAAFEKRKSAARKAALQDAATKWAGNYPDLFRTQGELVWETDCPACSGRAYSTGDQVEEEILEGYYDPGSPWEMVRKTYSPEEFKCPVCGLHMRGFDELKAAGLDDEHGEEEEREIEFEPDYGND